MIVCPKCANDNPLGRVFCGKCGTKLDFSHTTSQDMAQKTQTSWFADHGKQVINGVIVVILIPFALALWWTSAPIGKPPNSGGERRVDTGVKAAATIKKGQAGSITFAEEDVNAYFAQIKAKALGMESVSVSLQQGFFSVHMVKSLFSFDVKGTPIGMKLSYNLVCVPVKGTAIDVKSAKLGHLPLVGPLKAIATKPFATAIAVEKEWAPFMSTSELKVDAGKVMFTIKPQ